MKGSVIRRMYAGFLLLIIMFVLTVYIMMRGMNQIHSNFESVTSESLPVVEMANKTSVALLSADKAFKNFLTTQNAERMSAARSEFSKSKTLYLNTLEQLKQASNNVPERLSRITQLEELQVKYFSDAQVAMDNYHSMFESQRKVQIAYRQFQRLQSELQAGMSKYVADQKSTTLKLMSKGYFNKLKQAEKITADALASNDISFVKNAVEENNKAVEHINYAYRGLTTRLPELKKIFDASVKQFTQDIGQEGGVLDQHNDYLNSKNALYDNIANLATEVDGAMNILTSFNQAASNKLESALTNSSDAYQSALLKAIIIGIGVSLAAVFIGYRIAQSVREPLTRILSALESLTKGDMTQRIDIRYNNEFIRKSTTSRIGIRSGTNNNEPQYFDNSSIRK